MFLFHKDQAKKWVGTCPPRPPSSDAPVTELASTTPAHWSQLHCKVCLDVSNVLQILTCLLKIKYQKLGYTKRLLLVHLKDCVRLNKNLDC